jgi:erythromycin esterase-like protein
LHWASKVIFDIALLLLKRAISVIYHPKTERISNYFYADLPRQFDGVIHFDTTCAIELLDKILSRTKKDATETYPEGI